MKIEDKINSLSEQEKKIVVFLCDGLSQVKIADELKIRQGTVRSYMDRIFNKFGISLRGNRGVGELVSLIKKSKISYHEE